MPIATVNGVMAITAGDGVIAEAAKNGVIATAGINPVITNASIDEIIAGINNTCVEVICKICVISISKVCNSIGLVAIS